MNEMEALLQRRELLIGRIMGMECEIQKIDLRIAFLLSQKTERIDLVPSQKGLMNEVLF
ncbi:hypothetical protein [Methanothrix sp.]|uniref:hypothetical protein n=1 Tax=Methanothrix sp. TaxID=90426 RepID=UPI003C71BD73